ncbi:MAG: hypothetical protein A2W33_02480 [Chloroflexi bacterium RBG_16_52_11]|nr:MAG: hypothetical protein A2W33_02480 [Chloroflexi bacterium RBG_16_52_11]
MGTEPDHYAALGINRDATPEEIRRAYHRKARKLHPDVNEETGATELFLDIQYAYEVLSDPAQRLEYDQTLPPPPRTAPLVEFSTIYSRPTLLRLGEPQLIYVLLDLAAPTNTRAGPSQPLNLCLVIDRSTSMQGERMDMVKATAIELVRQVRPEDTLSIVTFSDRAEALVSAGRNLSRSTIEEKIRQILTSGGTEIYRGLEAGYLEVRSKANRTSVNHIILITDGRTYGDEAQCLEIAEQCTISGIGISSLGIGAGWNDLFLDGLTSRTGGSSVYVSRAQDIQQFLWQKFSGLGQVYADRVNLELFFNPGVELSYAFRLSPDVATLQSFSPLPLGSVLLQSPLTVLLELRVPPLVGEIHQFNLAEGKITLDIPGASRTGQGIPVKLSRPVSVSAAKLPTPTRLLQAMSRLNLYRMQERAYQVLAEGDRESATRHLQNLATRLFSNGNHELARAVMTEVDQILRGQTVSEEKKKQIKYGTRALLMASNFPDMIS